MKALCICQYGHSRSVAMCRVLHHRNHEAVACGVGTALSAIPALVAWADVIILMQGTFAWSIPKEFGDKVVINDVGPDIWSNPYNPDLRALCDRFIKAKGW